MSETVERAAKSVQVVASNENDPGCQEGTKHEVDVASHEPCLQPVHILERPINHEDYNTEESPSIETANLDRVRVRWLDIICICIVAVQFS